MAFCHEKTRTSEPLCVLESGDALLARVAPMHRVDMHSGYAFCRVSVVDYDGSLRYVHRERCRGKWQRKKIGSIDQVNSIFYL